MKLALTVAPETSSAYVMANAETIALLLRAISQDSERAVANRMADIEEIKTLLTLVKNADSAPNSSELDSFLSRSPESLHLKDVMIHHAKGFDLLIELHTWAEDHDAKFDEAIWTFLLNHTEREKFEW